MGSHVGISSSSTRPRRVESRSLKGLNGSLAEEGKLVLRLEPGETGGHCRRSLLPSALVQ